MTELRAYWLLLCTGLLFACASQPQPSVTAAPLPPSDITGWEVLGKAAVTGAEGSQTFNLRWSRLTLEEDRLRVSGPLGAGNTEIIRQGNTLLWRTGGQLLPISDLPDEDPVKILVEGVPLPLISSWLLGYPSASDQWQVQTLEWQRLADWRVPKRLTASSNSISVKVFLQQWQLEPAQ